MERIAQRKAERDKFLERRKTMPTGLFSVVIDLSYTDRQTEKEMKSLRSQINHCYGSNAHAAIQLPLHLTSFTGPVKEACSVLAGFDTWNIAKHEESYLECFPKDTIVYLTSDSPTVLDTFDNNCVYVIGGMVDHNRLKVCN